MRIGICPGSFDPITIGHEDIIKRAAKIFDKIYVLIAFNSEKKYIFNQNERIIMCKKVFQDINNIDVVSTTDELVVTYCKNMGINTIIKGLRNNADFEYEMQIAQVNASVGDEIETFFIPAKPEYSFVSSMVVREIAKYDGDISKFVPKIILNDIKNKFIDLNSDVRK